MNTSKKAIALFTTCLLLTACIESTTDEPATPPSDVVNGYYLTEIIITDANGDAIETRRMELLADEQSLAVNGESLVRLSPQHGLSGRLQYDENGNWIRSLVQNTGNTYQNKSFFYDSDGRLIRTANFVGTTRETNEEFFYDAQGKLISRTKTGADGEAGGVETTRFQYNDAGSIERATQSNPTLPVPEDTILFFYDSGSRVVETHSDNASDGSIDGRVTFDYDASGNVSQKLTYNGAGALVTMTQYRYERTADKVFNETLFLMQYYQLLQER